MNVGLIGYGVGGRVFHAPVIRSVEGLVLSRIAEHRSDAAGLLDDASLDLVVITTPNSTHFDLARRALEAGRHVVIDKPFTVTSEEATELIDLARAHNRVLSVFHNRRWDGDFMMIRDSIAAGRLGRIVSVESRFDRFRNVPRPGAWRQRSEPGSGILYDLGSHLIDQALRLFGAPASIAADVRRERDFGEADDAFDIVMTYDRMRVLLGASMLVREATPRFAVRGTEATLVVTGLDPQESKLKGETPVPQRAVLHTDRGQEPIEIPPGNYAAFYENVRVAIEGGAELAVKPEQARATVEIIERLLTSSRTLSAGQRPSSRRSTP